MVATQEKVAPPADTAQDLSAAMAKAIRTRRTIRRWTDQPVPDEIVKELLECALWAPSACNMQLWTFVVVTDPQTRKSLGDAVPFADKAPVCIFICYST